MGSGINRCKLYQRANEKCSIHRYFFEKQHGRKHRPIMKTYADFLQFELASRLVGVYKVNHMVSS